MTRPDAGADWTDPAFAALPDREKYAAIVRGVPIDPDDARELSRAAQMARTWLDNRDRRIREAHAKGAGLREIARLVGLTHPAVRKIVDKGDSDD